MSLNIPPEVERAIRERVELGQYESTGDVLRAALEALGDRELNCGLTLEELRQEVQIGLDDLDEGRSMSRDEVLTRLRELRKGVRV
ncbi:MAG TPA: hypothetical protein VHG91_17655 [Longimicrobium sp.]|nr:hypothetical protein [Longimicrobium sp.]